VTTSSCEPDAAAAAAAVGILGTLALFTGFRCSLGLLPIFQTKKWYTNIHYSEPNVLHLLSHPHRPPCVSPSPYDSVSFRVRGLRGPIISLSITLFDFRRLIFE
jgi:hypothetical protein